jgi:hypothetical protein
MTAVESQLWNMTPGSSDRIFGVDLRKRSRRRAVVTMMYSTFLIGGILGRLWKASGNGWLAAPAIALLVVGLAGYFLLVTLTKRFRAAAPGTDDEADEREARVRDQAGAKAYRYVSTAVLLGLGWLEVTAGDPKVRTPRTTGDWSLVAAVFMLFALTLPQALVAWSEPDIAEDDKSAD